MGGDLAVEVGCPAAGNLGRTMRTPAFRGQTIIFDQVAAPLDDCFATLRASRVFPVADHARQIARVDVAQSSLPADFDRAQQIVRPRISRIGHLVVPMKRGHVPGNVGGDASEEFCQAAQFVGGVVEAGNQQRHDLKPHAHAVNAADAVENRSDAPAEFPLPL